MQLGAGALSLDGEAPLIRALSPINKVYCNGASDGKGQFCRATTSIYLLLQLAFKLELMWEEIMQSYSWN